MQHPVSSPNIVAEESVFGLSGKSRQIAESAGADQQDREKWGRLQQGRRTLTATAIGETVHEVIGELLVSNVDLSDPGAIYAFVINRVRGPSISHMQSRRMKVSGNVCRYFSDFLRGDGWSFLGAELSLGNVRLDLLWLGPGGRIEADEIKTGFRAVLDAQNVFRDQLEQQVQAGQLAFGSNFAGVRAVLLAKPRASFLATPATHGGSDG